MCYNNYAKLIEYIIDKDFFFLLEDKFICVTFFEFDKNANSYWGDIDSFLS